MASYNGDGVSQFSPDSIQEVMRECDCTEDRARNLLRRSNNDPTKAIIQHKRLMSFISRVPSRAAPPPPIPPKQLDIPEGLSPATAPKPANLENRISQHEGTAGPKSFNSWSPLTNQEEPPDFARSVPVDPGHHFDYLEQDPRRTGTPSFQSLTPGPQQDSLPLGLSRVSSGESPRGVLPSNFPRPQFPPSPGPTPKSSLSVDDSWKNLSIPDTPIQTPQTDEDQPWRPHSSQMFPDPWSRPASGTPRSQNGDLAQPEYLPFRPPPPPCELDTQPRSSPNTVGTEAAEPVVKPVPKSEVDWNAVLNPQRSESKKEEGIPQPEKERNLEIEPKQPPEIAEPEPQPKHAWNFILPEIPPPAALIPGLGDGQTSFSLPELIGAIQHGIPLHDIQNYLNYFDKLTVKRHLNQTVEGFPAIFYAVASNNEWIIRKFVAYGADIKSVHKESKVPLLAFSIMHSETLQADTTLMVATLISLGANPQVIPSAFYSPYCRDLPDNGPTDAELEDLKGDNKQWCTNAARAKMARTTNLTQRYYLERASKTKKPSIRHRQIAVRRNAEALLGIPYFLIGQTMAANRLLQKLLSHLIIPSQRPLVLVFAGPSGHGKTELARRLGHLLSLELEVVDCTIFSREKELFGPRHPYVGADRGSPLNNFLARNAGQRCIVFLDEFEKTTSDIHQALLLPFDNGEYQDRRHLTKIDCSKTIWILATNALDPTIQNFCSQHEPAIFNDDDMTEKMRLMKVLSKELKEDFLSKFDSPITGRISAFLPFLPFSPGEQAVVVHKYLLELGQKIRNPVNLSSGADEHLLGNVKLRIRRDASVCRVLAEEEYHQDLGARSLITAVKTIEDMLVEVYLEVEEEIGEGNGHMVEFVVDVNGNEVVARMQKDGQVKGKDDNENMTGTGFRNRKENIGISVSEVEVVA